jgi:hypothetical protein
MQDKEVPSNTASAAADGLAELGVATAAAAIRNGDISSESYTSALLQRAQMYSDLNAFITIDEAAALAAARDADKSRAAGSTAEAIAEGSDMRARLYTLAPGDVISWRYHTAVTDGASPVKHRP